MGGAPVTDEVRSPARAGPFSGLLARFDTRVLMPPASHGDDAHASLQSPHAWAELQHWCLAEPARFSVAALRGPGAAALAHRLCLERDGSLQMQATNGAGRIALRLKAKLHDLMPWRARQAADAWDSGTLITSAAGLAALSRFRPRRATLIVTGAEPVDGELNTGPPTELKGLLARFESAQPGYGKPVRLLLLGAAADQAWDSARTRCIATDAAAVRVSTPSFS